MVGNFYARYPSSSGGVTSIDGITGGITLVPGTGISITDNSPSPGSITIATTGSGTSVTIERRTLTSGESTAKSITLAGIPAAPTKVLLFIAGGPNQASTIDFTVVGNTLSWLGLGLDGIFTTGDEFYVEYNT